MFYRGNKYKKLNSTEKRSNKKKKKKKHKKAKKDNIMIEEAAAIITKVQAEPTQPERNFKPMTEEEWKKEQSIVRRVYDSETGRHRLIKGSGEVLEEIVSKEQQKKINKLSTQQDGLFFEASLQKKIKHA